MIGITVKGLDRVISGFKGLSDKRIYDETIRDTAINARKYAKQYAAVDTGELEKSIYFRKSGDGYEIGATAPHAIFNEYGSYNIPEGARTSKSGKVCRTPFLRPAVIKATSETKEIFGTKLRKYTTLAGTTRA